MIKPEDDWIKLPDDDRPVDEHAVWCEAFLFLMAVLAACCILATMNGAPTP